MNPGDSVQDATRSGPDEANGLGAAADGADAIAGNPETPPGHPGPHRQARGRDPAVAPPRQHDRPVELDAAELDAGLN